MQDDLDALLLRRFAGAGQPLPDAEFTAQVLARIEQARWHFSAQTFYSILGTIVAGFGNGMSLPWRSRHVRLMALGAAAATLCTAFF